MKTPTILRSPVSLRNEGLVTISSQVKKIILLVSAPQKRIRIGGADGAGNGGGTQRGCASDHAHGCARLDRRFVRQEEVDGRARGGDRRTMWLPSRFPLRRGLEPTRCPPRDISRGEEEFDAGNAATPLDQIVTDRLTADDYPVVSLGQWTNFAELATGPRCQRLKKRIRIGGAEVPGNGGVARNGDVPPIMPMDARDLIVGCLDSLMSHPVSLTELFIQVGPWQGLVPSLSTGPR
ncbi:hypothetical protein ACJJTC_016575 [Scirpophaga incertulas]